MWALSLLRCVKKPGDIIGWPDFEPAKLGAGLKANRVSQQG